jgi:hypothetical protein
MCLRLNLCVCVCASVPLSLSLSLDACVFVYSTATCSDCLVGRRRGPAEIAELRRKFEEDKQRIERMKAGRQFRPY